MTPDSTKEGKKPFSTVLWCSYQRLHMNSTELVQMWSRCHRIWTQCLVQRSLLWRRVYPGSHLLASYWKEPTETAVCQPYCCPHSFKHPVQNLFSSLLWCSCRTRPWWAPPDWRWHCNPFWGRQECWPVHLQRLSLVKIHWRECLHPILHRWLLQ